MRSAKCKKGWKVGKGKRWKGRYLGVTEGKVWVTKITRDGDCML
jgi:hypothetical protein